MAYFDITQSSDIKDSSINNQKIIATDDGSSQKSQVWYITHRLFDDYLILLIKKADTYLKTLPDGGCECTKRGIEVFFVHCYSKFGIKSIFLFPFLYFLIS